MCTWLWDALLFKFQLNHTLNKLLSAVFCFFSFNFWICLFLRLDSKFIALNIDNRINIFDLNLRWPFNVSVFSLRTNKHLLNAIYLMFFFFGFLLFNPKKVRTKDLQIGVFLFDFFFFFSLFNFSFVLHLEIYDFVAVQLFSLCTLKISHLFFTELNQYRWKICTDCFKFCGFQKLHQLDQWQNCVSREINLFEFFSRVPGSHGN